MIAIIDLYSIKPLDRETILSLVRRTKGRLITVEDHYRQGGIGEAVTYSMRSESIKITCLAVNQIPRSGTTTELLAWAEIDAKAIVKAVKNIIIS